MQQLDAQFIAPQSGKARQLVIFLHGYGANGADLLDIGEQWAPSLPDCAFEAPDAPDVCEQNAAGFQWFSIRALDPVTFERDKSAAKVAPVLNAYIDAALAKWGVDESQLVVAGFSQGAMMAMYTMPRRPKACAGVIGYSGMIINADGLKQPGIVKMPILAIHGDQDAIVPPSNLAKIETGFTAAGFNVETAMRPGLTHNIDHFGLTRGLDFSRESFEKA
ncbi:MAG: dienelactone hydrolase family protein [Micavibrio sp.]|nr:dienelactone hydrolase family protein [Micavibrio sp.]